MRVDLHLHTTASDGRLPPEEVVQQAARLKLSAIAITDHDSVGGIAPALAKARDFPELLVIPGVEISTDIPGSEVHILGYFVDYRSPELGQILETLRQSRLGRGHRMVQKLARLGIDIDWGRVLELAGGASVGRPHLARAMLERGYVLSLSDAFTKYIGRNGPAYVEREKLTPPEAVELIVRVGGLPLLAHPANTANLDSLIPRLKQAGLVGLEAYYSGYSPQLIAALSDLACEQGLVTAGGSDYHGFGAGEAEMGSVDVPLDCVTQLLTLAKERHLVMQ